jgi:hypothetical protein
MRIRTLILLLLLPLTAWAKEPWLLSFPDITYDSSSAFFSGQHWTAIYLSGSQSMTTIPRRAFERVSDSLKIRPAVVPSNTVVYNYVTYRCQGNSLTITTGYAPDVNQVLPPPNSDAVALLTQSGHSVNPSALEEVAGPAAAFDNKIWFGLVLNDPTSGACAGGLGWYDLSTSRFGRLYGSELIGYRPQWVGTARDSVHLVLAKTVKGKVADTKMVIYDPSAKSLIDVNLRRLGVGGDIIVSTEQWGDTLLIATDRAVAVWKPRGKPKSWQSAAYAAPEMCWLYLKTFPRKGKKTLAVTKFLPLKSNVPTEVKAEEDGWLQVVSPLGIEGYVEPTEWEKNATLWSQRSWNCGDSLCFARLRVPMKEIMADCDLTNTELTYLARDANGVKVGFRAAWARIDDIAPVMISAP